MCSFSILFIVDRQSSVFRVSQMFDAKYVATAMSVACVVNWLCNFAVGIGFPYLQV